MQMQRANGTAGTRVVDPFPPPRAGGWRYTAAQSRAIWQREAGSGDYWVVRDRHGHCATVEHDFMDALREAELLATDE